MQEARDISIHLILEERFGNGEEVLSSLDQQSLQNFQVVMLGQIEGGREPERADDGRTMWLRNYRHRGFARIHNQAMALALSRWSQQDLDRRFIVLCHPDLVWDASALERMYRAFQQDPNLMIAGPTLLRARRVPQDDEGGYEVERTEERESRGIGLTRGRRWIEVPIQGDDQEPHTVFGVSEPCFMMRASAAQALMIAGEVLDPDLYPGQEVPDLMWRAAWLGMSVKIITQAKVWHYAHRPARQDHFLKRIKDWYAPTAKQERLANAPYSLMELKNDDPWLRIVHAPWILWERLAYLGKCLLDPRMCLAPFDPERWLRIRSKRVELKKRRRVTRQRMREQLT